jgi:hypothetical protein
MAATAFDHTIIGACENLRKESIDLAGQNHPMMLERKNGALAFTTDAQNGNVDVQVDQVGDGTKLTTLKILYDQPTRACQASTSLTTNICNDTTTTPTRKQFTKAISKKISSPGRYFSNDDLVILCQGSPEFIKTRLMSDLRATKELMNEVLLAELNTMKGKIYHWDGTETQSGSSKSLQLLLTSSGQDLPQPGNFVQIAQDFDNMKFSGVPAVIGDGYFDRYMRLNNLACCNSNTPYAQNVSNGGVNYFYDHKAGDIFGANKVLVIPYGLIHLITFNKNANIVKMFGANGGNVGQIGTEFHMVIPDPDGYPFSWNFDMKWDCTTERWKYMYSLHWDVFNTIQADSFASDSGTPDCSDDNVGVSGVFSYSISKG